MLRIITSCMECTVNMDLRIHYGEINRGEGTIREPVESGTNLGSGRAVFTSAAVDTNGQVDTELLYCSSRKTDRTLFVNGKICCISFAILSAFIHSRAQRFTVSFHS
jgi:hypothetical protein